MRGVVLDHGVLINYARFLKGEKHIRELTEKTISMMKDFYETSPRQLKLCKRFLPASFYDEIAPQAAASGMAAQELETLVKRTKHKIILTRKEGKRNIPYVNIFEKQVDISYTITCEAGKPRDHLLQHIKNLCEQAINIEICDKYLNRFNICLSSIFPIGPLQIKICDGKFQDQGKKGIQAAGTITAGLKGKKAFSSAWVVTPITTFNFKRVHDRYIRIDNDYEIILSSGFEYLFNTRKEITCIFREI